MHSLQSAQVELSSPRSPGMEEVKDSFSGSPVRVVLTRKHSVLDLGRSWDFLGCQRGASISLVCHFCLKREAYFVSLGWFGYFSRGKPSGFHTPALGTVLRSAPESCDLDVAFVEIHPGKGYQQRRKASTLVFSFDVISHFQVYYEQEYGRATAG